MLPVLFKITFEGLAGQVLMLVIALLMTAYGAWSGWRGADPRSSAPHRAAYFAGIAALVAVVGAVYAAPRFEGTGLLVIKAAFGIAAAVTSVGGWLYSQKIANPKDDALSRYGLGAVGLVVSFVVYKIAFSGDVGQGLGRGYGAPLHTYGLLIATAFIAAIALSAHEANRAFPELIEEGGKKVPAAPIMREHIFNLGFYVLLGGIGGARLLYVIVNWKDYAGNLTKLLSLEGGLVFYGGFIGAALLGFWYTRKHKLDFLRLADVAIPSVALGHAIGRLGCLAAGCCWGDIAPQGSKLAVRFPNAAHAPFGGFGTSSLTYTDQVRDHRYVDALGHVHDYAVAGAQQISTYAKLNGYSMPVYPTQLFESTGELLIFVALIALRRYKRFNGQILATWLMAYAILRTTIEFFRGDLARGYLFKLPAVDPVILSTSQTISLGIFAAGVAIWALYGKKAPQAQGASPAAAA